MEKKELQKKKRQRWAILNVANLYHIPWSKWCPYWIAKASSHQGGISVQIFHLWYSQSKQTDPIFFPVANFCLLVCTESLLEHVSVYQQNSVRNFRLAVKGPSDRRALYLFMGQS